MIFEPLKKGLFDDFPTYLRAGEAKGLMILLSVRAQAGHLSGIFLER